MKDARKWPLLPQQALFIEEYLVDRNGPRAARAAGYGEYMSKNSLIESMLRNPKVKPVIDYYTLNTNESFSAHSFTQNLLTDEELIDALPGSYNDGAGLSLEVSKDGSWQWKFSRNVKNKKMVCSLYSGCDRSLSDIRRQFKKLKEYYDRSDTTVAQVRAFAEQLRIDLKAGVEIAEDFGTTVHLNTPLTEEMAAFVERAMARLVERLKYINPEAEREAQRTRETLAGRFHALDFGK